MKVDIEAPASWAHDLPVTNMEAHNYTSTLYCLNCLFYLAIFLKCGYLKLDALQLNIFLLREHINTVT